MNNLIDNAPVCVVGLGYVGMPLARGLARHYKVIGFDTNEAKVKALAAAPGTPEPNPEFTSDPKRIRQAGVVIICVPTPVTAAKQPDLSYIEKAARIVGENLKPGSLVVLESTVFPGTTEEIVAPILEKYSGLTCGRDFKIGYSPERVSPGDDEHTLDKVTKVVAGMDGASIAVLKELYGAVAPEVFVARDIKTAEAAKVIENVQRDLNIALMNELSMIFNRIGVDTRDVLATAATKWNFNPYTPGLVGGHCIPVDPYYLVHKARQLNYASRVILAGRAINDRMPAYVAEMTEGALEEAGKPVKGARVLVMGLTYKENVADTRETPAKVLIKELKRRGMCVLGYEPLLTNVNGEFGVEALAGLDGVKADAFILTVGHKVFRELSLNTIREMSTGRPVLIDIRGLFDRREALAQGFCYCTL